jgi:hypothetical protein
MNPQEKYLLIADIVFALLSVWFLFPRCKMPLWSRLILVLCVWGLNAWFSYHDNTFTWPHYRKIYSTLCAFVALAAVNGWLTNTGRRRSLDAASDEFVKRHQPLLWSVVIALLLLIPIIYYLITRGFF